MKKILIIVLALLIGEASAQSPDIKLQQISFNSLLSFIGDTYEKSPDRMKFSYELGEYEVIQGFIYFDGVSQMHLNLFLIEDNDTSNITSSSPIKIGPSSRDIERVFEKISS